MESVKELTGKEFKDFIKKGFVVIDFFADWCMPCLIMAPIMEELEKKFKGKIKFGKIDTEENHNLVVKYQIRSIPNFILFKDGEMVEQFIGSMPAEEFEERLKKHTQL